MDVKLQTGRNLLFAGILSLFLATMPFLSMAGSAGDPVEEGIIGSLSVFPFNTSHFTFVDAPTVQFTVRSINLTEGETATITVELKEANGTAIEVDVAFLGASSSASPSDISGYTTQTLRFSDSDTSGTTKTVSITLADDADFEGRETAVFRLQNNTTGSIIEPDVLTLHIRDDDAPDIVFNEIHADPDASYGDANGDGKTDAAGDEFVELVNNENSDIDISNWSLSVGTGRRFIFPPGTVVPAGNAVVIFADTAVGNHFGGSLLFTAGTLGLKDEGGTLILADGQGNTVVDVIYPPASDGQSINRNPDISGGSYAGHATISGSGGALFSPGTKADGKAFGSAYAIGIRGREGWRMIASPTQKTSFNDLFSDFWMQGLTGSDAPGKAATIYEWDESEGGSLVVPANMNRNLQAGKGYFVYFFQDNEFGTPGIQGGFSKVIHTNEPENNSPVSVPVSAHDDNGNGSIDGNEGYNLLGNPFGTDISVIEVKKALKAVNSNLNDNILVWDAAAGGGNGAFVPLNDGDFIAPFQAFFVRYMVDGVSGNVSFNRSNLTTNRGSNFFKEAGGEEFKFNISLTDGVYHDHHHLVFNEEGQTGADKFDAFKVFSLNSNSINLFSIAGGKKLLKNVLPVNLETKLEIPLDFSAGRRESLQYRWQGIKDLPEGWSAMLVDHKLNKEIDLSTVSDYSFTIAGEDFSTSLKERQFPEINKTKTENETSRFTLVVTPPSAQESDAPDIPESVKLNPNYPNPFNPATTIRYELKKESKVLLSIWNIVGQKVATLADGVKEAGEHKVTWNASDMPSGIYIAQLEVGGKVLIRKMTLIK